MPLSDDTGSSSCVTAGETIPKGPRRRSNRPGNSQAKGPQPRQYAGECWAKCPTAEGASGPLKPQGLSRKLSGFRQLGRAPKRGNPEACRGPVGACYV